MNYTSSIEAMFFKIFHKSNIRIFLNICVPSTLLVIGFLEFKVIPEVIERKAIEANDINENIFKIISSYEEEDDEINTIYPSTK
jgi:hypothetical protein